MTDATKQPASSFASMADQTLVTVNTINLTGRQLWVLITGIGGLLATGGVGGWLFMPAKAVDLTALTAVVRTIEAKQTETGLQVAKLTAQTAQLSEAVEGLRVAVDALPRKRAEVVPEKPRKAARAAPKPVRAPAATASATPPKGGLFTGL